MATTQARRTAIDPAPTHEPAKDETVIVTLDDGSTEEFANEAEARKVHERAWVRLKREITDDKD